MELYMSVKSKKKNIAIKPICYSLYLTVTLAHFKVWSGEQLRPLALISVGHLCIMFGLY